MLYHDQEDKLLRAINSFLNTNLQVKLFLVDNSSNDDLKKFSTLDDRIEYIFNDSNLGYGRAHNIAIRKSIKEGVPYHVVLNSDVYFSNEVIKVLYDLANANTDVGSLRQRYYILMVSYNTIANCYQLHSILLAEDF